MAGEKPNTGYDQGKILADRTGLALQLLRDKKVFAKQGTERNAAAWEVVRGMGGAKGQGVRDWVETLQDPHRNHDQAKTNLQALAAVVYEDEFTKGTEAQIHALVIGPKAIDNLLPEAFKGLGETMADRFASLSRENGDIARALRRVDSVINGENPVTVEQKREVVSEAIAQITALDTMWSRGREGRKAAALKHLNQELPTEKVGATAANPGEVKANPVKDALTSLDNKRKIFTAAGAGGRPLLRSEIEKTINNLMGLSDSMSGEAKNELTGAVTRLISELDSLQDKTQTTRPAAATPTGTETTRQNVVTDNQGETFDLNNPAVAQWLRELAKSQGKQADYYERRGRLEADIERRSLTELLDAYVNIAPPRERQPQLWEYEVPSFMGDISVESWRGLLQMSDGMLAAVFSKRADDEYGTQPKMVKEKIMKMMKLPESEFKTLYEHKVLNIKEVLHQITQEMLVPMTVSGEVYDDVDAKGKPKASTVNHSTYVFKTEPLDPSRPDGRKQYASALVRQYIDNEGIYKAGYGVKEGRNMKKGDRDEHGNIRKYDEPEIKGLTHRLVDKGIVPNIEAAKMAVAFGMDILEIGGVFSAADTLRLVGTESDAVRLVQRPETKFVSKVGGGERWGGPWGEYADQVSKTNADAVKLTEELGVIPKLLAGSFLDHLNWMDKIYQGEKINLNIVGKDLYFGWRKDEIMAACDVWMYINGKNPLEFKQLNEIDATIRAWSGDLANAIQTLRANKVSVLPTSVIAAAVGGSTNLWPFVEGNEDRNDLTKNKPLYMRINPIQDQLKVREPYVRVGREIARSLGLERTERKAIEDKFHVNFLGGNRLGGYMSGYDLKITLGR